MGSFRGSYVVLVALLLVSWVASACGPTATPPPATQPPTLPPDTSATKGVCGDGVCDEAERANAKLCPQDCTLPEPPPEGECGDGVCDEREKQDPARCPQDCPQGAPPEEPLPGGGIQSDATETPNPTALTPPETPTPSATLLPGRARVQLQWTSSYGACPGRQVDTLYAEMEFTWYLNEDGELTGSGEGTMSAQPVSRCPDTEYGGVRTPEPYPVTVTSTVTVSGWMVQLVATDLSQAYFTNGQVYHEECILCWVLPHYEGLGVSGSLANFSLPRELLAGDTFRFEMDYHVPQPGASYVNDHVGEGTLEILEVPH
jgi:hypothetical protein